MISKALCGQANLSKTFQSFFIEAMELFLTIPNSINFLQMVRFGLSSQQQFRMNFRKKFDWISFNLTLVQEASQGMLKQWTLRSICLFLQSTLPANLGRNMTWICQSAMLKCSYIMHQWLNEYFQCSGKDRTSKKREGLTFGQSLSIIQLMRKRDYFLK